MKTWDCSLLQTAKLKYCFCWPGVSTGQVLFTCWSPGCHDKSETIKTAFSQVEVALHHQTTKWHLSIWTRDIVAPWLWRVRACPCPCQPSGRSPGSSCSRWRRLRSASGRTAQTACRPTPLTKQHRQEDILISAQCPQKHVDCRRIHSMDKSSRTPFWLRLSGVCIRISCFN